MPCWPRSGPTCEASATKWPSPRAVTCVTRAVAPASMTYRRGQNAIRAALG